MNIATRHKLRNIKKAYFLYTTITGNLQLIHLEEIGYFRYNSKSKLWEVMLSNKHTLILKRNTNSQKILSLHPYLLQISQSYIINISYLASIEDNNCVLLPPFNDAELLQVSKSFMKKLKEKYPVYKRIYYKNSIFVHWTNKKLFAMGQIKTGRSSLATKLFFFIMWIVTFSACMHSPKDIIPSANMPLCKCLHRRSHLPKFDYTHRVDTRSTYGWRK